MKSGYLGVATYGYKRDGKWVEPTLQYTARDLAGSAANDDDPGRVRPGANIVGASFATYMTYSAAWNSLSEAERDRFRLQASTVMSKNEINEYFDALSARKLLFGHRIHEAGEWRLWNTKRPSCEWLRPQSMNESATSQLSGSPST